MPLNTRSHVTRPLTSWNEGLARTAILDFVRIRARQPFRGLLDHDQDTLHSLGKQVQMELFASTHTGMSEEEELDKTTEYGITLVSMKRDWNTVFGEA